MNSKFHTIPIERLISAGGFVTALGGGTLSPRAREAMASAAEATWRVDDLQEWAGGTIARITGAEAGWVTAGAAAGLTLAAAACIAGTDRPTIDGLPDSPGERREIIVQRGHRNAYDRMLRTAGGQIVEAGYPLVEGIGLTYGWQLEAAFSARTAAILHVAAAEQFGLPLASVCELASARDVPVIVDVAAELPPVENLRSFLAAGASLVCFSGGKAIRGPQASGVLAGRRDLIDSVRLQTLDMDIDPVVWRAREGVDPPHHGIGRGFKVAKEEITGLVAALEDFVQRDHEAEARELVEWLQELSASLAPRPSRVLRGPGFYPRLVVEAPAEARAWAERLASVSPAIVVPHHGLDRGELVVRAEAIDVRDREHVARSLAATAP